MKKMLWLLALMMIIMPQAALADNLIRNPGFEEVSGSMPADWQPDMWEHEEGVSELTVDAGGYAGNLCAKVVNLSENDARFTQTVPVEPGALYRITCRIRVEGVKDGEDGAGISIKDTFATSELLYDTQGAWVPVELYGIAGDDQTELTVMARLGGYGSTNIGTAWFDEFSMEKVDSAPVGAEVNDFTTIGSGGDEESVDFSSNNDASKGGPYTGFLITVAALSFLLMALAAWGTARGALDGLSEKALKRLLWLALAAGLAVRALIAVTVYGYGVDMGDFAAWGARMVSTGPSGFYSADVFCDYPPGYMLVLWALGSLRALFGLGYDSRVFWLILKLPAILLDLAAAYMIYREGQKGAGRAGRGGDGRRVRAVTGGDHEQRRLGADRRDPRDPRHDVAPQPDQGEIRLVARTLRRGDHGEAVRAGARAAGCRGTGPLRSCAVRTNEKLCSESLARLGSCSPSCC